MKKKFSIKITKPIIGKRFGTFQHIIKGIGSEKVDIRKYFSGDNASQINWKRTAKYQELYTNIFQQEKSLILDLFLDINYNRRGGKFSNREQVFMYTEDILSYCKKQQITVKLYYPNYQRRGTSKLVQKEYKQQYEFHTALEVIFSQVQRTKPYYTTHLQNFLHIAVKNKKRRVIVIFSDFLAMNDKTKQLINYLKKQHIIFLFQLPIDPDYGQNYEYFFLNTTALAKKSSDEIELLQIN